MENWFIKHKEGLLRIGLLILVFLIGLALPSPFFRNETRTLEGSRAEELVDTTNMIINGGLYSGTISKNNHKRNGYGRYETQEGSVYEGNWKDDKLRFGTRTTPSSVYTGHFDTKLNNEGFGIINYSESYMNGKSRQGLSDSGMIPLSLNLVLEP